MQLVSIGCIFVLSSISMQLMQATPISRSSHVSAKLCSFSLLPASTTYRAGYFVLQAVEVEQEPLLGSVSAREEQDFVDYARPRGWGRGGYQKLCQHDLS